MVKLSHRTAVLCLLNRMGCVYVRDLRNELNKDRWFWQRWSVPGFYLLLQNLLDEGWIQLGYDNVTIEGQPVKLYWSQRKDK